jgi:hypothetical protein
VFDERSFSFITGRKIKNYKNYFFISHEKYLKIVNSVSRNGRLDFHVIMEISLPLKITNIHISNLNDILISTTDIANSNRFFKLNMELISKRSEFPVLHGNSEIYRILISRVFG